MILLPSHSLILTIIFNFCNCGLSFYPSPLFFRLLYLFISTYSRVFQLFGLISVSRPIITSWWSHIIRLIKIHMAISYWLGKICPHNNPHFFSVILLLKRNSLIHFNILLWISSCLTLKTSWAARSLCVHLLSTCCLQLRLPTFLSLSDFQQWPQRKACLSLKKLLRKSLPRLKPSGMKA